MHLYENIAVPIYKKCTLITFVAFLGAMNCTRAGLILSDFEIFFIHECPGLKRFPRCHFKDIGHVGHFLIKCHVVALDDVKVSNKI